MIIPYLDDAVQKYSRLMFLGESGSGKSEVSLNYAIYFAAKKTGKVHFFDMDQTKPLFRSRDLDEILRSYGVVLHHAQSLLDVPTLPAGVREILENTELISIFDVGGNSNGARMVGQFADLFDTPRAVVYYLVNYFRPFSYTPSMMQDTLREILRASGQKRVVIIMNPNLGAATTLEDILSGLERTVSLLEKTDYVPQALVIGEQFLNDTIQIPWENIIPIKQYLYRFTGI
jgi:hypothetical protein